MTGLLAQNFAVDWALLQGIGYVAIFLIVAPLFPFLYLVLRWRDPGTTSSGTYGALLYFRTTAALLLVAGTANLTYGHFSTTPIQPELTRLSWGLFWGNALFLGLNIALGRVVRVDRPHETRRVFLGFLMILAGLLSLFSLVMLFITLHWEAKTSFDKETRADEVLLFGVWSGYFLATYVGALLTLTRSKYAALPTD